jgi:hypothetical protein
MHASKQQIYNQIIKIHQFVWCFSSVVVVVVAVCVIRQHQASSRFSLTD